MIQQSGIPTTKQKHRCGSIHNILISTRGFLNVGAGTDWFCSLRHLLSAASHLLCYLTRFRSITVYLLLCLLNSFVTTIKLFPRSLSSLRGDEELDSIYQVAIFLLLTRFTTEHRVFVVSLLFHVRSLRREDSSPQTPYPTA